MNGLHQLLEQGDVVGLMRLWREVAPHLSQPADYAEGAVTMHRARTEAKSIPVHLRRYSHAWLEERGLPSGLPDELKPEPVHPIIANSVGISVRSSAFPEVAKLTEAAMSNAVLEMYADGVQDPTRVKARMMEARIKTKRAYL